MKKIIAFLITMLLVASAFAQNYGNHNIARFTEHNGYIYANGSSLITSDSTLRFSVDNTTIQDEDLSNANVFTLNSGNTREIPDPANRRGRIIFIKNGTGTNVSLTEVSNNTMWADTLEGGGTIAPGELLMLVSDGEYWYARSPQTFASVKTDSITSRTNNTNLKLVGQGTGLVEIEGAYTLPGTDGTNGQALITNGSGVVSFGDVAAGDVTGPATSTDNAFVRFDGTTGKIIQNSGATLSDAGLAAFTNVEVGGSPVVVDSDIGVNVQAWDQSLDDISGLALTDGNIIVGDGANWVAESGATARTSLGAGDVNGPGSSTDNTIPRFDGTSGKIVQGSSVEIDDSDNIDTPGSLTVGDIISMDRSPGESVYLQHQISGNNVWITGYESANSRYVIRNITGSPSTSYAVTIANSNNGAVFSGPLTSGQITSTALTGTGDQILYATSGGEVTRSSVDLADVSTGGIQTSEVTISSANFLNINTSPVTIVSAPGAGNYIVIMAFAASMDYNSTTYSCAGNLRLEYATSGAGTEVPASTYCSSSDQAAMNVVQQTSGLAIGINQALVAKTASGDPTTGNSNIKIKVWYTIESI